MSDFKPKHTIFDKEKFVLTEQFLSKSLEFIEEK